MSFSVFPKRHDYSSHTVTPDVLFQDECLVERCRVLWYDLASFEFIRSRPAVCYSSDVSCGFRRSKPQSNTRFRSQRKDLLYSFRNFPLMKL